MSEQDARRPAAVPGSAVDPGSDASTESAGHVQDRETQPPAGSATGASGGYGVGSDRSAGGSGEPEQDDTKRVTSADTQTDWLRGATGGPSTEDDAKP